MTRSPLNGQSGRSRLAICGYGEGAHLAPWDSPEWDIWGCNSYPWTRRPELFVHDGAFRADQWWQIHPLTALDERERLWLEKIPETDVPTVVLADQVVPILTHWPAVPRERLLGFTAEDVRRTFPDGLFASTFCLQIASALELGYQEIALYGCDCIDLGRELVVERPGNAYWQGVAHAMGVKCWFARPSTLGHHPYVYGAEYAEEARFAAEVTERVLPRDLINSRDGGNLNTVQVVEDYLTSH